MDEVATMRRVIELTGSVVDNIEPEQLDNPSPLTIGPGEQKTIRFTSRMRPSIFCS